MGRALLGLSMLLTTGCSSAWMTIPSSRVRVADSRGPVALYFTTSDDDAGAGMHCRELTTRRLRWSIPNLYAAQLELSTRRQFFFFGAPDGRVRFFRTEDGAEVAALTEDVLGVGPDRVEHHVTISDDGRVVAIALPRDGDSPPRLRLVPVPHGPARELTVESAQGLRDLAFGPPGWLVARQGAERRVAYRYGEGTLERAWEVPARQAWWADDGIVAITPDGRFTAVSLDGTRLDTPQLALSPETAATLDDRPERVRIAADGGHLLFDGGDHVALYRLSDGDTVWHAEAHAHRGSNYRAILSSFFTPTTAGLAFTANDDFEGRLTIVDLASGTPQHRELGELGSYGGGLAGFDISPSFRWNRRPKLSPTGDFILWIGRDDTLVERLAMAAVGSRPTP
jgi:hypothetical protein